MLVTTKLGDSIISVIYYSLPFEICLFHSPAGFCRGLQLKLLSSWLTIYILADS